MDRTATAAFLVTLMLGACGPGGPCGSASPSGSGASPSGSGPGTSPSGSGPGTTGTTESESRPDVIDASGITMVLVAAGTFEMGCTPEQEATGDCFSSEYPVHNVTLTHDFWMAETEVTQAKYEAVMGVNPAYNDGCDDCAVEGVSWYDAAEFVNALSSAEGLGACYTCPAGICTPVADLYGCTGYRLPTEAEWEYAARCGNDFVYAGSDDYDDVAWTFENHGYANHVVATKAPNSCGLFDLSGNVMEWASDWWDFSYDAGLQVDPLGAPAGVYRVLRGGSWNLYALAARASFRDGETPSNANFYVGFRPVRSVP